MEFHLVLTIFYHQKLLFKGSSFCFFAPVLSGNVCSHPTKLSVATVDLVKKKLEKNPTLTASQMKMRMTP
jgi:hypothetical protein